MNNESVQLNVIELFWLKELFSLKYGELQEATVEQPVVPVELAVMAAVEVLVEPVDMVEQLVVPVLADMVTKEALVGLVATVSATKCKLV